MSEEFNDFIDMGFDYCPDELVYQVISADEPSRVQRSARMAALKEIANPMVKKGFDTRRINQETERNPRTNLQYWHRSDDFIEESDAKKMRTFSRLYNVLTDLKNEYGKEPEWFESYARVLYDTVHRILRIKQADMEVFKPQISYLEQLIYARYRLGMNDIRTMSKRGLANKILSKDEDLMKRGDYLDETKLYTSGDKKAESAPKQIGDGNTQESIINAIFGNTGMRRDGEKTVERTITITVRDQVID